jgi:hypothetical protein
MRRVEHFRKVRMREQPSDERGDLWPPRTINTGAGRTSRGTEPTSMDGGCTFTSYTWAQLR